MLIDFIKNLLGMGQMEQRCKKQPERKAPQPSHTSKWCSARRVMFHATMARIVQKADTSYHGNWVTIDYYDKAVAAVKAYKKGRPIEKLAKPLYEADVAFDKSYPFVAKKLLDDRYPSMRVVGDTVSFFALLAPIYAYIEHRKADEAKDMLDRLKLEHSDIVSSDIDSIIDDVPLDYEYYVDHDCLVDRTIDAYPAGVSAASAAYPSYNNDGDTSTDNWSRSRYDNDYDDNDDNDDYDGYDGYDGYGDEADMDDLDYEYRYDEYDHDMYDYGDFDGDGY